MSFSNKGYVLNEKYFFSAIDLISFVHEGKYIPASQRPDGTWRKARRVKDGYIPQEEVPLYESKGKQFMKKPTIPVGMCPIVAQETKLKRERELANKQSINPIPGLIVLPGANNQSVKKATQSNKNQNESTKSSTSKNKTKKPINSSNASKRVQNSSDEKSLKNAMENLTIATSADDDLNKKLKKLRKKLREIESIEQKLASGELKSPEQDQLDKVARKKQISNELIELEKTEKNN